MSESAILSLPTDTNIGKFQYQHLFWMHADHYTRPQQERPGKPSLFTLPRTAVNVYEWENGAPFRIKLRTRTLLKFLYNFFSINLLGVLSVSKTCLVRFDNNRYSVLSSAVGRPVEIQAYADRIVIRRDGVVVGDHIRSVGRGETVFDPWLYVPVAGPRARSSSQRRPVPRLGATGSDGEGCVAGLKPIRCSAPRRSMASSCCAIRACNLDTSFSTRRINSMSPPGWVAS
jgi:hypothetical protein